MVAFPMCVCFPHQLGTEWGSWKVCSLVLCFPLSKDLLLLSIGILQLTALFSTVAEELQPKLSLGGYCPHAHHLSVVASHTAPSDAPHPGLWAGGGVGVGVSQSGGVPEHPSGVG